MGRSKECRIRYLGRVLQGEAYLETDHIHFRGTERIKIPLKEAGPVKAEGGVLVVGTPGGPAEFELGKAAAQWAEKILHPPTRAGKLGVKAGLTVRLVGEFGAEFHEELRETIAAKGKADLVFLLAEERKDLAKVAKLTRALQTSGALWVVYPKGVKTIREMEVIESGRAAGLKDVKVASFSATHTALKFVIPLENR
jgi:hypothetical protein